MYGFEYGRGAHLNRTAWSWMVKSAELQNSKAKYFFIENSARWDLRGQQFPEDRKNLKQKNLEIEKNIESYIDAANKGYQKSQYLLSVYYSDNSKDALYWLHQSAENGYDIAQYSLALHYLEGDGVVKNPLKAIKLFLKSKNIRSHYQLGLIYDSGEFVDKNYKLAFEYFKLSSKLDLSRKQLSRYYELGLGVIKNQLRANYWERK